MNFAPITRHHLVFYTSTSKLQQLRHMDYQTIIKKGRSFLIWTIIYSITTLFISQLIASLTGAEAIQSCHSAKQTLYNDYNFWSYYCVQLRDYLSRGSYKSTDSRIIFPAVSRLTYRQIIYLASESQIDTTNHNPPTHTVLSYATTRTTPTTAFNYYLLRYSTTSIKRTFIIIHRFYRYTHVEFYLGGKFSTRSEFRPSDYWHLPTTYIRNLPYNHSTTIFLNFYLRR